MDVVAALDPPLKHVDFLLIGEDGKRHYVLVKDFSTFMYDHTLYREKKTLLFTSSKTKLLKSHVNDWFKISGKQLTQMPKQVNVLDLKIMAKK